MDRSDLDDDPEEGELINEGEIERKKEESTVNSSPVNPLDFYQADPFAHCQSERTYQTWSLRHSLADETFTGTLVMQCTQLENCQNLLARPDSRLIHFCF